MSEHVNTRVRIISSARSFSCDLAWMVSHLFIKEKLRRRVSISLTLHQHIIPLFDWPLILQFEEHIFCWIWLEESTGWGVWGHWAYSWHIVSVCTSDSQSSEMLNLSELSCLIWLFGMLYSTVQWKTDLASALTAAWTACWSWCTGLRLPSPH